MRSYLVKRGLNIPNITIQYLYFILTSILPLDSIYLTSNTQKYTGVALKLFQTILECQGGARIPPLLFLVDRWSHYLNS